MPAKTIDEAIDNAMIRPGDFKRNLKNELRDLFAHQAQIFAHKLNTRKVSADMIQEMIAANNDEMVELAITGFFRFMFKDIPATPPSHKTDDDSDSGAMSF